MCAVSTQLRKTAIHSSTFMRSRHYQDRHYKMCYATKDVILKKKYQV